MAEAVKIEQKLASRVVKARPGKGIDPGCGQTGEPIQLGQLFPRNLADEQTILMVLEKNMYKPGQTAECSSTENEVYAVGCTGTWPGETGVTMMEKSKYETSKQDGYPRRRLPNEDHGRQGRVNDTGGLAAGAGTLEPMTRATDGSNLSGYLGDKPDVSKWGRSPLEMGWAGSAK
ncbi:hypothetical protein PILCRDRAFT_83661 [Piloderma croceum F 1598]|uniref:Uncharacterized protein n=1 Tax=Piloderma croceum (strain F 1598) TaxID=765440 RepID=A0A0C3BXU9_PILCF|nr:hypothetical protein PILCRDRAFT_83661 [Piloderma croceum F 1598]